MAKNIEQVITEAADKMMQAIEAYGPKATELVLETGRLAAMQEIATGFGFLFVFLFACGLGAFCIRQIVKLPKYDESKVGWGFVTGACGFVATVGVVGSFAGLVNMFAWVGLRHPEIYLAAKLFKL